MVRPVEQIEQEIAKLDQATAALAQEFRDAYEQYFVALGQAVRQQFVLASYHLCTHGYPEQFLQLSLHQRQELQRSLRQLAKQTQSQIIQQLDPVQATKDSTLESKSLEDELQAEAEQLINAPTLESTSEAAEHIPADRQDEVQQDEVQIEESRSSLWLPPDFLSESLNLLREQSQPDTTTLQPGNPPTPISLALWQKQLEERIVDQLQTLSHTANRLFQQANVLPKLLPEPVLEVASKADLASETTASPPNLLNLLIESESDEEATMTQVTTIRLRLSEIEFSDATVAVLRSKVRTLMAQLNKLGREYQKRQKEQAIAQAESAWRSSWYED
jgi:hypothetical protein